MRVKVQNSSVVLDYLPLLGISTDMNLTEEEIIELYGKRWTIEVFFKICKSYLNLGSEFRRLSYDAITAHTVVVMVRYMI